jgi:hypothetical protein
VASPTTLTDHFPRWARSPCVIPILFVDQLSIPEKMDQGCRKDNRIPEFSGVISTSAPHPHRHQRVTNALRARGPTSPATIWAGPNAAPARPADLPCIIASSCA